MDDLHPYTNRDIVIAIKRMTLVLTAAVLSELAPRGTKAESLALKEAIEKAQLLIAMAEAMAKP